MRNTLIVLLLFCVFNLFSQRNEFTIYNNGLIYSDATMKPLKNISDSLNLKFRECSIDHEYFSLKQTRGHHIQLDSIHIRQAKADMEAGISFDDFVMKYPQAKVKKNLLVVQFPNKDKDGKEHVDFDEIAIGSRWGYSIENIYANELLADYKNKWVYKYYEKDEYSDASIDAFYFPNSFVSTKISDTYARMIGYTNCMIDTSSSKIYEDAEYGWAHLPKDWQTLSLQEKDNLLDSFRHTRVVGTCSMDDSPRVHAKNIALLSSEVANWNVFLKAHLDILNDRFERMSDGSYAWGGRLTYLKEIEELDINTLDLLFGIVFRIDNPAKHHYFGSPGRIGRAFAESSEKSVVENRMVSMIEDHDLDDFNRVLVYFTFNNYIYHLIDKEHQKSALKKLKKAVQSLPDYLENKIVFK